MPEPGTQGSRSGGYWPIGYLGVERPKYRIGPQNPGKERIFIYWLMWTSPYALQRCFCFFGWCCFGCWLRTSGAFPSPPDWVALSALSLQTQNVSPVATQCRNRTSSVGLSGSRRAGFGHGRGGKRFQCGNKCVKSYSWSRLLSGPWLGIPRTWAEDHSKEEGRLQLQTLQFVVCRVKTLAADVVCFASRSFAGGEKKGGEGIAKSQVKKTR